MSRYRFTIAGLLVIILVFGLACAALRSGSEEWTKAVVSLTVLVLLFAVLAAVHGRGAARAYWTGFALFGWFHLLMCYGLSRSAEWTDDSLYLNTYSTDLVHRVAKSALPDRETAEAAKLRTIADPERLRFEAKWFQFEYGLMQKRCVFIAQALISIAFGILGGAVSVLFYGRCAPRRGETPAPLVSRLAS